MGKHAYLIMAHDDSAMLKKLLVAVDDCRNDIYVHLDKRSKLKAEMFKNVCKCARLEFVPSSSVKWGGESQIIVELKLMEFSRKRATYTYYHLLSGHDYPLANQDIIHAFFDQYSNTEFIDCEPADKTFLKRVKYYYPLQEVMGRNSIAHKVLRKVLLKAQMLLKIDRCKNNGLIYYKGANWFSVTDQMVSLILDRKKQIQKEFYCGKNADEMFLQTIYMNSDLSKEHVIYEKPNLDCDKVGNNLRFVDFQGGSNGSPRVLNANDIDILKTSGALFVRKCDSNNSEKLIQIITNNF